MRVAIAVDNNMVTEHFGHCEYFAVYEVVEKEVKELETLKNPPHQKGFLPKFLKENNVDVVLVGNMGKMAVELMNNLGIECYRGVKGSPVDVIKSFAEGTLQYTDIECNQHNHSHECH